MAYFNANLSTSVINPSRSGAGIIIDGALIKNNSLNVNTGVVGSSYHNTYSSPTNGLIIEGNVGIGVTSPSGKLHIDNGAQNTEFVINKAEGTNADIIFRNDTSKAAHIGLLNDENLYIENDTNNNDIIFKTTLSNSDEEFMRINTSDSSLTLTTNKKISFRNTSQYIYSPSTNRLDIISQRIDISTDNQLNLGKSGVMTTILGELDVNEAANFDAGITASGNINIDSASFYVDSTKNKIGIGITQPLEKLHIEDSSIFLGKTSAPGNTAARLYNSNGNLYWNGTQLGSGGGGGGGSVFSTVLSVGNNAVIRDTLSVGNSIIASGNVSIDPGNSVNDCLNVKGNINITDGGVLSLKKLGSGTITGDNLYNKDGYLSWGNTIVAPKDGLTVIQNLDGTNTAPVMKITTGNVSAGTIGSVSTVIPYENGENKTIDPQGYLKIKVGSTFYYMQYFTVTASNPGSTPALENPTDPVMTIETSDPSLGRVASGNTVIQYDNPESKTIDPQGYLKINVSGTNYYLQYFTLTV